MKYLLLMTVALSLTGGTGYEYHKKVNKFIDAQAAEDLDIDFETEAAPVGA